VPIEQEATKYIAPSPTLESHQRIELYNQQYWWRFLSTLQDTMPLLARLFGNESFNQQIAVPYFLKYPSDHWSINFLANRLPQWAEEEYHEKDRPLVLQAARIDWAYNVSFYGVHHPMSTSSEELEKLLDKHANLQPHVQLFELDSDLFAFRMELLKEDPDYWEKHDFPELKSDGPYYFVLYRNGKNAIVYQEVSKEEYLLLQKLQEGNSISDVCDWLEQQPALSEAASEKLHLWMQEWIYKQWLFWRSHLE